MGPLGQALASVPASERLVPAGLAAGQDADRSFVVAPRVVPQRVVGVGQAFPLAQQAASPRQGGGQHETSHAVGVLMSELLGNSAAERVTQDVDLVEAQ